ncbi:hypothetical protein [Nitrospira sp. KM1]|uniref:hypothetical protein n=1 Tax=Nitrospira sp. KM1 TaxID=1936990 RepID=UPI001567414A|nr:hypothetical protein [Nitrospira sp. KM1]
MADQDIDEVFELFVAGSSVKLNPPLPSGRSVTDFVLTPDRTAVIYRADQDADDVFELYRVTFANPGVSTKLNGPLPPGANVSFNFVVTKDSSSVLYLADETTANVLELYRVSFVNPTKSTRLNGPLVAGGNVFFRFAETPDSSAVVYFATELDADRVELFRVPFATPRISTRLSDPLQEGDVDSFVIAPNGLVIVHGLSRQVPIPGTSFTQFQREIFLCSAVVSGSSTKLNGPFVGTPTPRFVHAFDIRPDSASVVYTTADTTGDYRQLYWVPFAAPGMSTRLNGVADDNFLSFFRITPDGSAVVYAANTKPPLSASSTGGTAVYRVPFTSPGVSTRLSGTPVAGGGVHYFANAFAVTPDSSAIVYLADETTDNVLETYRVPFTTPGSSTRLNGPIVAGGSVSSLLGFSILPDSSGIVYAADEAVDDVIELYRSDFSTPGVSTKQNGPLVAGGNVDGFIVQ